jgi:hypothetical protein
MSAVLACNNPIFAHLPLLFVYSLHLIGQCHGGIKKFIVGIKKFIAA